MFCFAAILALGGWGLHACTSAPKKSQESAAAESKLSAEDQKLLDEYRAELELGRNMAGRLLQFYGTLGDDRLTAYINQVGGYVGSYSDYPERRYMIEILDSDTVNAFACPGGYILLTKGALHLADTEAELGMILGHEVAHVGRKHMFNTLRRMTAKEMEDAAKEAEKNGGKGDQNLETRKRPEPEESEAGKVLAKYLAGSSGAGFSILQAAKAGMSVILEKGLDKELEFEADHEGVKYAIRSGYEPRAMLNFLERLKSRKKSLNMKVLETTHPKIEDRQSKIQSLLAQMNAKEIVGASGKARYEKYKERLPALAKK